MPARPAPARPVRSAPGLLPCAVLVLMALLAAPAAALEAGSLLLGLEASVGPGDFASHEGLYMVPVSEPLLGLGAEGWYVFTDRIGVALAATYHRGRDVEKSPGLPDRGRTFEGWSARLGLDRFIEVDDEVFLYLGPGVEFWSGRATFRGIVVPGELDGPRVRRVSGTARLGALLVLSDAVGLLGHLDARLGPAWTAGGEEHSSRWYAGGVDASFGLVYAF